jgi:hypothetical protein
VGTVLIQKQFPFRLYSFPSNNSLLAKKERKAKRGYELRKIPD